MTIATMVMFFLVVLVVNSRPEPWNNGPNVKRLREGVDVWNSWREKNPTLSSDVEGSDLRGMNLSGADFRDTAFFTYKSGSNLDAAVLRRADFTDAHVANCSLVGTDLSGARLRDARFDYSELDGAVLSGTDATGAAFNFASMTGVNLVGSCLSGATLCEADLTGARLEGADFTGAYLVSAKLSDVKDWRLIASIRCANIYGITAPDGFRKWALNHGALMIERGHWDEWLEKRDACLGESGALAGQ